MDLLDYLLITLAAVAAGAINALAGGGTLVTFPTFTALGIPAVAANITNVRVAHSVVERHDAIFCYLILHCQIPVS